MANIEERTDDMPKRMYQGESKYVYPKRKPLRMTLFVFAIIAGIVGGGAIGIVAWKLWLEPAQHHMMYPNEAEDVAAKWEGVPVTVSADLVELIKSSTYYDTPEYWAMLPEEKSNGTIVFNPQSGSDMYAFVRLIRDEIDGLIETDQNDMLLSFFGETTMSKEYDKLIVKTPMKKDSLIDKKVGELLLKHMKIQALLYHPGENPVVTVTFVNDQDGSKVLSMQN